MRQFTLPHPSQNTHFYLFDLRDPSSPVLLDSTIIEKPPLKVGELKLMEGEKQSGEFSNKIHFVHFHPESGVQTYELSLSTLPPVGVLSPNPKQYSKGSPIMIKNLIYHSKGVTDILGRVE